MDVYLNTMYFFQCRNARITELEGSVQNHKNECDRLEAERADLIVKVSDLLISGLNKRNKPGCLCKLCVMNETPHMFQE